MEATEIKSILSDNREMVINFFYENVKTDRFFTLKWFMTRVLEGANYSWKRRRNIAEKDVKSVLNGVLKDYPMIKKGYMSNWQKAVNYYGEDMARNIANAR